MALARDGICLGNLLRAPFRRAPIEHLALVDEIAHRPRGFLNGRLGVGPMAEVEIEIIDLEPFQRLVAGLHDMLAAQPFLIGLLAAPKDFAGDKKRIARPVLLAKDISHHRLGTAAGVSLGVVEEIDALVVGRGHQVSGDIVANLLTEGDP